MKTSVVSHAKPLYRLAALIIGAVMFVASAVPAGAFIANPVNPSLLRLRPVEINNSLLLAASQPSITNLAVNPDSFNPKNDDTSISFNLSTGASVTIRVFATSGTLVKTIIQNTSLVSAYQTFYWSGKDNSGDYVKAGDYIVQVEASNAYGKDAERVGVNVYYDTQAALVLTSHYAKPTLFDPNTTTTTIYYTLNKSAYVTVRISKGSSTVKYLKSNSYEKSGSAVWDGKNQNGTAIGEGTYTYEIFARLGNEEVTGAGDIIVQYVVTTPVLKITSHYASPSTFDPSKQNTAIYYTFNKSAYITIKITTFDNNIVKNLKTNSYENAGVVTWDGKDLYGNMMAAGTYKYNIQANINGESVSAAGNIIVQYQTVEPALQITNHYADPKTFDPYDTNTTVFYTLNQVAYVTIKIKSGWGTVKTIQTSASGISGGATWDGRKSDGDMVSEGTYQYEISAYLNNANVTATGYITVDFDYPYPYDSGYVPYLTNISINPDPFNPYLESTELKYTIKGGSAYATIEVYDKDHYDNKLIDTLVSNVSTSTGTKYIKWDGKDYAGTIVKEGIYTFKIIVSNSKGSDTEYAEVEVDYDVQCSEDDYYCGYHTKPYIFNDYASPNPFKVGGNNETKIYFSLNTGAKVTVTLLKDNNVIRSLQTDGFAGGGKNYVKWNGKDYKGNYVSVGTYMYKIYAENSYGTDIKSDYLYVTATVSEIIPCGGYNDIDISSPYCKAIIEMGKLGIFEGYGDGTFGAYNPINRAELVKVVLRALNKPIQAASGSDAGFTDVNVSAWYMNYIYTARLMGVINGYPDGTYRPAKTVNKVEMLKIFLNSAGTYLPECKYAPYKDTPVTYKTKWYLPFACYAKKYSLIDTDTYGNLSPAAPMKRGDVAELFYRYQMQNLFNKITNPTMN